MENLCRFSNSCGMLKKNNCSHKDYVYIKSKNNFENEDPHHGEAILDYFKFKRLEKANTKGSTTRNYC